MEVLNTISAVREWRKEQPAVAFVPTMGNLHEGHLQLVREAKKYANKVIVSIFVNPTQFGVNEDFASYPRTQDNDCKLLLDADCDAVFLPTVETMYGENPQTTVSVAQFTEQHCGTSRIGHFDGVATIVCKLFNIVQPDFAVFGLKDFQQFAVIKKMTQDLNLPIEIVGVPTVRESDGLAMSSRNGYLTSGERKIAPKIYETLTLARENLLAGQSISTVETIAKVSLAELGFNVDYFNIARQSDLALANDNDLNLIVLTAAKLGNTRLIDNVLLQKITHENQQITTLKTEWT